MARKLKELGGGISTSSYRKIYIMKRREEYKVYIALYMKEIVFLAA